MYFTGIETAHVDAFDVCSFFPLSSVKHTENISPGTISKWHETA
jgi:hypothetical protein